MRKLIECSILVAGALSIAGCAGSMLPPPTAQAPSAWRPVDAATGQMSDVASLEDLALAFPDSGSVHLRLLNAYLEAENLAAAGDQLNWLSDRGYRFGTNARTRLQSIFAGADPKQIAKWIAESDPQLETSEFIAEVPGEALLVEGLAVDPHDGSLAVAALVSREIWRIGDGDWESRPMEGLGNLSGIAVDPAGGIWLAAGNLGMLPAGEQAFAGLVKIGSDSAGPARFPAPAGVNLSDIALGKDGAVYASDPLAGGIYRLAPGADAIEELVPPGNLRSPQGLAEGADGRWLYVSDYRYGLAAIDLASGKIRRVATELPILLDGIDALIRRGEELIAVQNGTSPMQLVAFEL
ncbi:MAG TPA: hypothetical protein VLA37_04300, partial [Sphingomonadaceae bacterium]|nr:hypothetical protein [Sphingomonadaceae bacterium]